MSASLIGRFGSSTFRLSTTGVLMSLAGSRFSSESALRPFHHGVRRRGGTIYWAALPSDEQQVQADIRTHLTHRPARDIIPPRMDRSLELQRHAYANVPLPIGFGKTISQPFIVGLMTDLLDISADDAVLEVGTGLGYQTAILSQLAHKVYSIEIVEELGRDANRRLR